MAPYSARNKVPTIQKLGDELAERLNLQRQDASKLASGKGKDNVEAAKAASRRRVIDPTTKNEVVIQDVDADFAESIRRPKITVPKAGINPKRAPQPDDLPGVQRPFLPEGDGEEYRQTLDDLAPPMANPDKTADYLHHSTKHEVLYHPLPVADLKKSFSSLERTINLTSLAVVVGIMLLNWMFVGGRWKGFFASLFAGVIVSCGIHLWLRGVQEDANAINWDAERDRANAAAESLVPESVEWLNSMVSVVWKLINPEMFAAMADTLEDVMQASVPPSIIQNVKVSSIGLGDESFKILSLRALPSAEDVDEGGDAEKKKEQRQLEGEDDPSMNYYNLEASFAYNAIPATGVIGKAKNLHLEVIFYLGVQGLFGVPLPVFVELNGIVGTIRLRFQLTPNAPFLRNLTFTFMGLPKIDASAVPLTSKGFNVLDLPLISGFINSSIAAALDIYVAPKSLCMDMSKLLQGDAVKKETDAVGLIYVKIKRAEGLSAQDKSGSSDPYITLAYSQFGKPVYCTRIIEQELNPTWNEQVCLLVYQDQLTEGEKLSLELWDSDKMTADDVVGKVKFDLRDLIKDYSNTITEKVSEVQDAEGKTLPGKLYWEIGYFPRSTFKSSMRTHGQDLNVPHQIRDRPEFQDAKGTVTTEEEKSVTTTPPDPSLPSGICCILIHQVENLEVERPSGSFGSYEPWTPAQITGENTDEEGDELPSSYCSILQNDELVFRTRTKVRSSTPIFNAQTERFVRDWRNEVYTITCRNAINREHDQLLGSITIKLSEVLQTASQNTAVYALDGGMGYGRITVSVLFRSVDLRLPKNLLGWNVGSFEVLGDGVLVEGGTSNLLHKAKIAIHTDVGKGSLKRKWIVPSERGTTWSLERVKESPGDLQRHRILIPVRQRYKSPVRVEFYTSGNRKAVAYAIYWLCDIVDNTETVLSLPIYRTPMPKQMTQNYIANIEADSVQSNRIGTLKMTVRFKMGMDESHQAWLRTNDDYETYEAWQCNVAEGYRKRIVKRETPKTVRKLVADGKVTGDGATLEKAEESDSSVDPDENVVRVPRGAPGYEKEIDDYHETSSTEQWQGAFGSELTAVTTPASSIMSDDRSSLDIQEDLTDSEIEDDLMKKRRQKQDKEWAKADLRRKQRGPMNIKRVRNLKFFKDEMKIAGHRIKDKFSLKGRDPTVETEM